MRHAQARFLVFTRWHNGKSAPIRQVMGRDMNRGISRRNLLIGGGAGVGLVVAWAVWPRVYPDNLVAAPGEAIFNSFVKRLKQMVYWIRKIANIGFLKKVTKLRCRKLLLIIKLAI